MASVDSAWVDVVDDDGWEDVPGTLSVADMARRRLAARGLTPEAIKANPDLAVSSPDDFTYTPKATGETFGGAFADAINPVQIIKNVGSAIKHDFGTVRFGMDAYTNDDSQLNPVPDLVSIAREAYRRGEAGESLDDMYGALAGNAALTATTMGAGKLVKGAPKTVANAEAAYAGALSTPATRPLTESLASKMMDRRIVVNDPKALITRAEAAGERATAAREAIPPARTSELGDPAAVARGASRRSLAEEAKFQANLRAIAEAIPEQKTLGNVLTGAGKMGAAGAALSAVGLPVHGGVANVVTGAKLLYEVPRTLAFKTAKAIAKKEFGQAMAKGDKVRAAEIGAGIATGALAADDFGHRAAITSLAQEVESLGGPDLRRQAVASKRGYYRGPDNREVEIPRNVMSALVDAPDVSEADSPLNRWLTAMASQKKIAKGGQITFR